MLSTGPDGRSGGARRHRWSQAVARARLAPRRTGPLADRREDDIALLLLRRDPDGAAGAVPVRRTV